VKEGERKQNDPSEGKVV